MARHGEPWTSCRLSLLETVEDEIELAGEMLTGRAHPQLKFAPVEAVSTVAALVREIELRGKQCTTGRLYPHVDVPGAAGVDTRHDRPQREAPVCSAEQMTAQTKATQIVRTAGIRLPNINERPSNR